jgi:Domain of Unknown Function (DUF1259)
MRLFVTPFALLIGLVLANSAGPPTTIGPRSTRIEVTALHSHMIDDAPHLFYAAHESQASRHRFR